MSTAKACHLAQFSWSTFYRKSQARDQVNKKRVRRLYRLEGLQLRMRIRRRKHMCLHRGPVPVPSAPHERWSMDFVHDQLFDGRPFRLLTVVDQLSRESPLIEVDFSMSGHKVAAALDRCLPDVPIPISLTVDHGTEFTSRALEDWAWQRGVKLDFTRPGKPTDNSHIESCNGRLRDECLNVNQFLSIDDAKRKSKPGDWTTITIGRMVHLTT